MSGFTDFINNLFGGSGNANLQYFPPFQQSGGITANQEDYTQYGYQQNLLADASQFAGSGTGQSTMATQAAGGARIGKALQEGQISDINAGAILNANNIAEANAATANQQNQGSLLQLASQQLYNQGFQNPPGGTQSSTTG